MKLYKLEAVRGCAAFYVVLHHAVSRNLSLLGINIGFLLRFGQEAVILFFLLSGFVINYSFQKGKDKSFSTYLSKRFYRLFIPLLIICAFGYAYVCLEQGYLTNPEILSLLMNLLMLQDVDTLKPAVLVSPYMGNTPLWSLSYEWWFYMLYYPIAMAVKSFKAKTKAVLIFSLVGAVIYVASPHFVPRLAMYFSIWWVGVALSQLYLEHRAIELKRLLLPLTGPLLISIILSFSCLKHYLNGNAFRFGVHPVLEVRHFLFSIIVVILAIGWMKISWLGFDTLIKPFESLAPISYGIYISHHYLVVRSTYLSFLNNSAMELTVYILVLLAFSYLLELKAYPWIKNRLTNTGSHYVQMR